MAYHCPVCGAHITHDNINENSDRAVCLKCGTVSSFRQIEAAAQPPPNLSIPPKGTWFRQSPDGFVLGASTRSWLALLSLLMLCGSLYFVNAADSPLIRGRSGQLEPTPVNLFLSIALGLFLWAVANFVIYTVGKVEVMQIKGKLTLFTGVGPIGWRRSFQWADFSTARETEIGFGKSRRTVIQLGGQYGVNFGSLLTDSRRCFIAGVLSKMLSEARSSR